MFPLSSLLMFLSSLKGLDVFCYLVFGTVREIQISGVYVIVLSLLFVPLRENALLRILLVLRVFVRYDSPMHISC